MSLDYKFFGLVPWLLCLRAGVLMEIKHYKSQIIRGENVPITLEKQ